MFTEKIKKLLENNYGKVIGSVTGFIIALLFLVIGFFKTIFLLIFIISGYYIGSKIDNRESLIELLDKILPPGKFR